jgi:hypothetical protein
VAFRLEISINFPSARVSQPIIFVTTSKASRIALETCENDINKFPTHKFGLSNFPVLSQFMHLHEANNLWWETRPYFCESLSLTTPIAYWLAACRLETLLQGPIETRTAQTTEESAFDSWQGQEFPMLWVTGAAEA